MEKTTEVREKNESINTITNDTFPAYPIEMGKRSQILSARRIMEGCNNWQ